MITESKNNKPMNQLTNCLFIVITITALSCGANGANKEKNRITPGKEDFSKYLALKEKATLTTHGTDTTFLQFRFGMSPDEVKKRLEILEKDSTIIYDYKEGGYSYEINTGRTGSLSKVICLFTPEYHLNQMYCIKLISLNDAAAGSLMASAIMEKYGAENAKYKLIEGSAETYVWFSDHVEIKVNELVGGAVLSYTDLRREKEFEKAEQNKSDKEKSKTQANL